MSRTIHVIPFNLDNIKTFREAEKEEILESEVNHNFEADMYLEKLEQDNEKVMLPISI